MAKAKKYTMNKNVTIGQAKVHHELKKGEEIKAAHPAFAEVMAAGHVDTVSFDDAEEGDEAPPAKAPAKK